MSKHHPKPSCLDVSGQTFSLLDFRNVRTFLISKIDNLVQIFKILKLQSNFKDSGKSTDLLNHKNHNVIFNDMGRHSTQLISAFTIDAKYFMNLSEISKFKN